MPRVVNYLLLILLMQTVVFSTASTAAVVTFEKIVLLAMHNLKISRDDSDLLVITNAPYVIEKGTNALPWLDQAQEATGCMVGKGNLLFFQRPQNFPFCLMLFSRKTSDSIIISHVNDEWRTDTLNIKPSVISEREFWEKTYTFQANKDMFTLAILANVRAKGAPNDFLKTAELHYHIWPGLTSGYLMAHYILNHFPLGKSQSYTLVAFPVWCKEDALQIIMDCTPGKGSLIVKNISDEQYKSISIDNSAAMVLLWDKEKKIGQGAALSFSIHSLISLSPKGTPLAAKILASLDHLDHPDRFISTAAQFDLDEKQYQAIIKAGNNPWKVVGLAK